MKRNILVAHGGGPTTVINASLFGVIDEANSLPMVVSMCKGSTALRAF